MQIPILFLATLAFVGGPLLLLLVTEFWEFSDWSLFPPCCCWNAFQDKCNSAAQTVTSFMNDTSSWMASFGHKILKNQEEILTYFQLPLVPSSSMASRNL